MPESLVHAYNTAVTFFQGGGIHMYPILITFAFGLVIAIERWLFLAEARENNREAWEKLLPLLSQANYTQALSQAAASNTAIGRMLAQGLTRFTASRKREEIELAMEEALMESLPRLEKRTHYLHMLANVAMLFGLLGTVMGLITGFTAIATADPSQKAQMLSASFSVAMNATAFGLIAAIPLLLVHSILQTRTGEVVESLEMAAVKFLNLVTTNPAPAAAPSGR
jgi:biopolymer transport protein ExbB/TolQ